MVGNGNVERGRGGDMREKVAGRQNERKMEEEGGGRRRGGGGRRRGGGGRGGGGEGEGWWEWQGRGGTGEGEGRGRGEEGEEEGEEDEEGEEEESKRHGRRNSKCVGGLAASTNCKLTVCSNILKGGGLLSRIWSRVPMNLAAQPFPSP